MQNDPCPAALMGCIKVLDEDVVQRIAAGEALQRPVNAVKELLENSLDAGATRVAITVQVPSAGSECGLFSITVTDNGHGIWRDDLALLCERHATSKLSSVSDLGQVQTFGFRGEALASCSQVARVEVVTRRRRSDDAVSEEQVAWRAEYLQGKMQGTPEAVAGNPGTTIHVRDLFYSNRVRREALQKSPEEYAKILHVVQAYAIDRATTCSFSLSKRAGSKVDFQTDLQMDHVGAVRVAFGDAIAGALMPFSVDAVEELGLLPGCRGCATRTTFHGLKTATVLIFLNGRLIEHAGLRRAMLQTFAGHLPTSPPCQPFIYLSLQVKGSRIDVNVHPSKRQVFLLDEAEIIQHVLKALDEQILRHQYSSQPMQTVIINSHSHSHSSSASLRRKCNSHQLRIKSASTATNSQPAFLYPSQRVLTDARNTRIDSFLFHTSSQGSSDGCSITTTTATTSSWSPLLKRSKPSSDQVEAKSDNGNKENSNSVICSSLCTVKSSVTPQASKSAAVIAEDVVLDAASAEKRRPSEETLQKSALEPQPQQHLALQPQLHPTLQPRQQPLILSLQKETLTDLLHQSSAQVSKLLCSSVVVGVVDSQWSLLQSGTFLLLADHNRLAGEMFFWKLLQRDPVQDTDWLHCNPPCQLDEAFPADAAAAMTAAQVLREWRAILDVWGVHVDSTGTQLLGLSALIPGHRLPPRGNIVTFLARLCLLLPELLEESNDSDLAAVAVAREVAQLLSSALDTSRQDWPEYLKHCLLPALKDSQVHYALTLEAPALQIITNTEALYRSFERC